MACHVRFFRCAREGVNHEEEKIMKNATRKITYAAMIAALYAALTLILQPLSFSNVQFRVSEALTILPTLTADAIPGLSIGCLLANWIAGAPWFDVVFGTLATLLGAFLTYKTRKNPLAASLMPVLTNGLITGPVVYFGYVWKAGTPILWGALAGTMASVAGGELVVCVVLGLLLRKALLKTKLFK